MASAPRSAIPRALEILGSLADALHPADPADAERILWAAGASRARVLLGLDDRERTRAALADAAVAVERVGAPRDRLLLYSLEGLRARERLASGALEDALAALDRAAALAPPGGAPVEAADLAVLGDHRRRAAAEHGALLDAVHRALSDAARRGEALPAALLDPGAGLHAVCAWCRRLRRDDGAWVPLGQFVPATVPVRATHGICDVCREVLERG